MRKIEKVFISHLHGDHFLGLPGLLYTMALHGRKHDLFLYGPRGLDEILIAHFKYSHAALPFKIHFREIDSERQEIIFEDEKLEIESFPLKHRIACCGFLVREKTKPRRIQADKIPQGLKHEQYIALKNGEGIVHEGLEYSNESLTGEPRKSRTYAFCSDTVYLEKTIDVVKGIDLLYHEATFTEEYAHRAPETGHSTAKQAATVALKAGVKQLVVGHFSTRYRSLTAFLEEAREVFENTHLAIEGRCFSVED